ncbi:MAG: hypothetical protein KGL63_01720 [Betaproteobacteria bacterium]|nr:hypothetical protein [Betaproteobacteria bacterium]
MTHRGPLEDAWRDLPSRVLLILTMLPFAAMMAGGVGLLITLAWRSL